VAVPEASSVDFKILFWFSFKVVAFVRADSSDQVFYELIDDDMLVDSNVDISGDGEDFIVGKGFSFGNVVDDFVGNIVVESVEHDMDGEENIVCVDSAIGDNELAQGVGS